jgi:hypothetical protein
MTKDKKEDRDMETPVIRYPRSFLELLGYYRNPDGTLTGDGPPTQKEKLGELLKEENEEFFIAQIDEYLKKKDSCTSDKK